MPEDPGDTEITIPTYKGLDIRQAKDELIITIYAETGKTTIRCYHFQHEKN